MLPLLFPVAYLANELLTTVRDNARDKVSEPDVGSVVYCDLFLGTSEHSGIYVGNNTIIHYNRNGVVEPVSPDEFIKRTTAVSIYVGCIGSRPVGAMDVANNAEALRRSQNVGNYNVLLHNCHQFSDMCITGKESSSTFLWMLKDTCRQRMGVDSWRIWDRHARRTVIDGEPSAENLARLECAIENQRQVIAEQVEKVYAKHTEMAAHVAAQPAGGLFYWSRLEGWSQKYARLQAELDSLRKIADEAEKKRKHLVGRREEMKRALGLRARRIAEKFRR